ncbi:helix-turn-helix domain-containing protein [Roseivirga pacifica]|uniref:helix-turn-helix domain-containing protein n=1 Tax=Roseivirga pacifica TaxID=1267423 RepID=UPI00227A9D91|nr:helix-turn-helix domain-containing protein [Roseivirga pacifica]
MLNFKDFEAFNSYVGLPNPLNAHVDVGQYDKEVRLDSSPIQIDFYRISFKTNYINTDSPEYTPENPKPLTAVFFNSPGKVYEWHLEDEFKGYYLHLSKELIDKNRYLFQNYLEYGEHEALYLTEGEKSEIIQLFELLLSKQFEQSKLDELQLAYINLMLRLIESFYKRQFKTDTHRYSHIIVEFQQLLKDYYKRPVKEVPSVHLLAEKMNLSPNYLGDIVKSLTQKSAIDTIHEHIMNEAKKMLEEGRLNNMEVAFALGFDYPNYFSKFFKKRASLSPSEYRKYWKDKVGG